MQNALRQQLELDRDAAVHRQQLEIDRHAHALQLVQEAHTAAQTESDRLKQKHAQELQLCEVNECTFAIVLSLAVLIRTLAKAVVPVKNLHLLVIGSIYKATFWLPAVHDTSCSG